MKLRKLFVVSCIGLAATGMSGAALAQSYFSAFGSYTMADEFNFQVAPGTITSDFDDGYGLGVAYGKRFGTQGMTRWRVEGELSYRNNDIDTHSLNGGAALPGSDGELSSTALMANAVVEFGDPSSVMPYLGGGIGLAQVNANDFGVTPIPNVLDDDDTVLAYQLIAGLGWELSPGMELFAEYRWFATEDADVTTSAATGSVATSIEYQTNNVLLGARWTF